MPLLWPPLPTSIRTIGGILAKTRMRDCDRAKCGLLDLLPLANGYAGIDGIRQHRDRQCAARVRLCNGQASYVEVVVQSNLPPSFGKIFTNVDTPVLARSVALGQPLKIGLILLNKK